ncbi:Coiled-coil domain-containing protein 39 [Sorochytrium milnesiophthora]
MLRFEEFGALPPFANAENKRLDEEVRAKEAKLTKCSNELEDNVSRTNAMMEHMRNVQQELNYIQQLYDARNREIETEEHLKAVADRELGRLTVDLRKFEKDMANISDQASQTQNHIYRANERIAKLKSSLSNEQKELEDWLQVQREKEEDNLILLKYSKEDDQRIKDLTLQIERLMGQANRKRNQLNQEITETQVSQIELEKTTEEFRRMHRDRQDLLTQWESAVDTMKQRDEEIVTAQEHYQKLRDEIRQKQAQIEEKQKFLDSQLAANTETEKKLESLDRIVSSLRLNQQHAGTALSNYQDEVDAIKTHLSRTSNDIMNKRSEVKTLRQDLHEKKALLESENENVVLVKQRLSAIMNDTGTKEEKAAQLQALLAQDEARSKELDKQIKSLKEQTFKKSQDLFKLHQEEKTLQAEISGAQAAVKNLQSKISRLDQESLKQQALLYNQEYSLQQLERKVRRAQGDRTDEEKQALNKRIEELNTALDIQTKSYTLISTQLKRSQDDMRHAKRKLEVLAKERQAVAEQIDDLNLCNTSAGHQLTAKVKEKEDLMVEENILRLELKKTRGFLNARADEVYSLKSRQVHLHYALEERTKEIVIHKDMLKAQIKIAEEERHSAAGELRERAARVEKMKRRYEILMDQFGGGNEEDEEKTQASYIIKAAQEREELQRSGDQLDAKIQKAEKEIKALENTLAMMNGRNDHFRSSLQRADLIPEDIEHKQSLEQQLDDALLRYRQKRRDIQDLQRDLVEAEAELAKACEQEGSQQQAIAELESRVAQINRELVDQDKKRERAWTNVIKLAKDVKRARGVDLREALPEEIDMQIRETKELTNMIFARIGEMMQRNPDIELAIQQLYQKAGIQPPSRPTTRLSTHGGAEPPELPHSGRSSRARSSTPKTAAGAGGGGMAAAAGGRSSKPPQPRGSIAGGTRADGSTLRTISSASSRASGKSTPVKDRDTASESEHTSNAPRSGVVTLGDQLSQSKGRQPGKLQGGKVAAAATAVRRDSTTGLAGRRSRNASGDLSSSLASLSIGGNVQGASGANSKSTADKSDLRASGTTNGSSLSNRIKRPARPGSASSDSSRGSVANLR